MNTRRVYPASALLSPLWLAALGVLAVNDQLLKGAGVVPGVVTGKLSDVAGMIVAPALLACVLAVRSRGGLLGCHVAVGAVFASIKISATAAGWMPWQVVVDPTDLLVLPMLWVAWRGLLPAMQRDLTATARRGLATAAGGLGLLVCAATSPPRHYPEPRPVNPNAVQVNLTRPVQGTVEMRCDDGARMSQVVAGTWAELTPLPAAGAECKLQLLGVPGSFGPVTQATRQVECNVSTDLLTCRVTGTAAAMASQ